MRVVESWEEALGKVGRQTFKRGRTRKLARRVDASREGPSQFSPQKKLAWTVIDRAAQWGDDEFHRYKQGSRAAPKYHEA